MRRLVFKSSAHWYGCEQDDPAFFTEEMRRKHPPRTPIERDIVEAEARGRRVRREAPGDDGDDPALRQRPRPRRRHAPHPHVRPADGADDPRLRPPLPVRPLRRRRPCARARRLQRAPRHLQRRRRRRARALRGDRAAGEAAAPGAAPLGDGPARRAAAPARRPHPRRDAGADALRPRARQPPLQGDRLQVPLHLPRGGAEARRAPAAASRSWRGVKEPYRYEREVEEFLRWSPHVHRDASPKDVGKEDAAMFDPSPPVEAAEPARALASPLAGRDGGRPA